MRYCIFGFDQRKVLELQKKSGKSKRLDIVDMFILDHIYGFKNRKNLKTVQIRKKEYFWVDYGSMVEDLPILNIKKQALKDRLDKLEEFDLIEKKITNKDGFHNMTFFRMGKKFEDIIYFTEEYELEKEQREVANYNKGMYSDTERVCSELQDKNITISNNINSKRENEIEKSISNLEFYDKLFKTCWEAYKKKGNIDMAKKVWDKIAEDEKNHILPHIRAYTDTREIKFQKNFEKYLKEKVFNSLIYEKDEILYDPTNEYSNCYFPYQHKLDWNNYYKCYMYWGDMAYFDDGYMNENRPNGATIEYHKDHKLLSWSKEEKKWVHIGANFEKFV